MDHPPEDAWKHTGVRVIPSDSLDSNTAQTPGIYLPFHSHLLFSLATTSEERIDLKDAHGNQRAISTPDC
jgi:hypothetical protein